MRGCIQCGKTLVLIGVPPFYGGFMSEGEKTAETLENLCRRASLEADSKKLNQLIEQIDFLLDEQQKARLPRRAA